MNFESQEIFPNAELCLIKVFMETEYNISAERWLIGTGIDADAIEEPELLVSLFHFDIIHRNIFRLTNDSSAALKLGRSMNLSRWGPLLTAFITSESVGHALITANRFASLVRSRFALTTEVIKDEVKIKIGLHTDVIFPVNLEFGYEVMLGTLTTQIQDLCAHPFNFTRVKVTYSRPEHYTAYEKHLGCPVEFDSDEDCIYLSLKVMTNKLPLANKVVARQVRKECKKEIEKLNSIRSGDISWQIIDKLNASNKILTLEQVAEALSLNPRTLRRKLKQAGTTFSLIVLKFKQQKAAHLIMDRKLSIKQIASECGYQTAASFRSAFRSWYGTSPSDYRKNLWSE